MVNLNKYCVEKMILIFYLISHLILLIYMLVTRNLAGDFYGLNVPVLLSNLELIVMFCGVCSGYILLYFFYKFSVKIPLKTNVIFQVNKNLFDKFYFILLVSQNLFTLLTGVGIVFSESTNHWSPLFSLLNVDCLFGLYYFLCRRKKTFYLLNIGLFFINNLIRGWTGVIMILFFYEIYCQSQKGILKQILYKGWFLLPPIFFASGGFIYKLVYPLKIFIRLRYIEVISYGTAVVKLVNRISFFSSGVLGMQNMDLIAKLYYEQGIYLLDFKTMLKPLLPRFLMPHKEFRGFGNLIELSLYSDIKNNVSTEMGLFTYFYLLLKTNIEEVIVWILVMSGVLIFFKFIYSMFEEKKGQLNLLWFLLLIDIIKVGSLSVLSSHYLYLIYMIPIMVVFKIIKVYKIKK